MTDATATSSRSRRAIARARALRRAAPGSTRATFAMVRVAAAQTGLKGPITASEQTDDFAPDAAGPLAARAIERAPDLRRRQRPDADPPAARHRALRSEPAGLRRAPRRRLRIARRHAARHPRGLPLPEGGRQKAGGGGRSRRQERRAGRRQPAACSPAARIASARSRSASSSIRTSRSRCRSPASATSTSTCSARARSSAGSSAAATDSWPFPRRRCGGTRWQLAGRAFGIASSYNDRAFEQGREQYTLDIRQRPAQAAVWVLRPLSRAERAALEYDWDYTKFGAAR